MSFPVCKCSYRFKNILIKRLLEFNGFIFTLGDKFGNSHKKKHRIAPVLGILFTLQFSSLKPLFTLFKYTDTNFQQNSKRDNLLFVLKKYT